MGEGAWNYGWTYASANTTLPTNITWTDGTGFYQGSSSVSYPVYITPVTAVSSPESEPDGPLDWLRGQVAEICELAKAA